MTTDFFTTTGAKEKNICISNLQQLTGNEAGAIREKLQQLTATGIDSVYIDATKVTKVDLSGINEIINTNYVLKQAGKPFRFAYSQHSEIEKWVSITGLDKFVSVDIISV